MKQLECGPMPNVTAVQSNIGGALCESSVISFLVPRCKVRLTPTGRVPCSNAASIGVHKTWTQSEVCTRQNSVREQKHQENVGKCVPAQETAKHHAKFGWLPLNDVAAVTKPRRETRWNLLGCPKLANRSQPFPLVCLSCHIVGHVEEILLFNKFFRLLIHALVAKIQLDKIVRWCADDFWRHFCVLYFSEPCAAHFRHAF